MTPEELQLQIDNLKRDLDLFKKHDHLFDGERIWYRSLLDNGVTDATLTLTDVTTNDVSITKHGFAPKAPNDTTKFLRGDATWNTAGVTIDSNATATTTLGTSDTTICTLTVTKISGVSIFLTASGFMGDTGTAGGYSMNSVIIKVDGTAVKTINFSTFPNAGGIIAYQTSVSLSVVLGDSISAGSKTVIVTGAKADSAQVLKAYNWDLIKI